MGRRQSGFTADPALLDTGAHSPDFFLRNSSVCTDREQTILISPSRHRLLHSSALGRALGQEPGYLDLFPG